MIIEKDISINKIIEEDIVIKNSSTFHSHGIVNGNIYVEGDSTFYLHGMLNGDLITEQNSMSYIYGMMNGGIFSDKGIIELSGVLHTNALVPENVIKLKGCYINNKKNDI